LINNSTFELLLLLPLCSRGDEKGDDEQLDERDVVLPSLVVRDEQGKWTKEYARVMQSMSIPVV